ncbi:hypothetical protein [Hymenobacter wooponensis]|uniref:Exosortase system-associated protein, TIGR04073 family n=1 Tax=Hymenobacter wooponensis TaxID=1525360 RepID=A0A4Z0MUV9_9BACT|nr:hypothetical protein [Hymenobacter wooponensis]TGD83260.1 hypothetical protein EU557_05630 [Hymenobacter wooponensis]
MTKPLLLIGLLGLFAVTARAQGNGSHPSEKFKQHLRAQYLHNDTAQAIINLYSRRQGGGVVWVGSAILASARLATSSGSSVTTGSGMVVRSEPPDPGVAFLLGLPVAAYGVGKLVHYSNGKLERTLTAYAAGQPLPKNLRRKLKPRFFNQPIIQYTPVQAATVK